MNRTLIEWALNPDGSPGYTWNPITGCLNHTNGLCKGGGFPCYAYKLAHGRLKQRYLTNPNTSTSQIISDTPLNMLQKQVKAELDPFYPRFWEEKLGDIPQNWQTLKGVQKVKTRGIFVCDMSDLFGIGIPEEWTRRILDIIKACPQHRFYLLTKQAARLSQFSPFPENCWVGITATNTDMLMNAINCLESVKARVKYISFEPLLSWADTSKWVHPLADSLKGLNWLIIGACTGSLADMKALRARYPALEVRDNKTFTKFVAVPPPAWVREIITAADAANIPIFIKDNILDVAWGDYRLTEGRREFPKG